MPANRPYFRTLLVFSGIFTFLVDAYPLYAASSLAANSFARSSFGGTCLNPNPTPLPHPALSHLTTSAADDDLPSAAFPLFGVQMYRALGDQWATSLLAFLTVAMMPFPYLFFKYGKRLRGKSRFATS